jgi:hypothetical protein
VTNDRLRFAGAGEEGAVEYIEGLLTAFDFDPPHIYRATVPERTLPQTVLLERYDGLNAL